jgi:hypothetical protein
MRFQANPDGAILAQNDIVFDSLLNYFEIGD